VCFLWLEGSLIVTKEPDTRTAHFDGDVQSSILTDAGLHLRRKPARQPDSSSAHPHSRSDLLEEESSFRDRESKVELEGTEALGQKAALFPLSAHELIVSEASTPGLARSVGGHRERDVDAFSRLRKSSQPSERASEDSTAPTNPEAPGRSQLVARFEIAPKRLREIAPAFSEDSRINPRRSGFALRVRVSRTPNPLVSRSR
jgi:hypothetical protein